MKRTALRGLVLAIASAISRIVPDPEPSSLTPGPSSTLSRCAPTTITLSSRPGVCAITLRVGSDCEITSIFTRATRPVGPETTPLASSLPTAKAAASTGRSPIVAGRLPPSSSARERGAVRGRADEPAVAAEDAGGHPRRRRRVGGDPGRELGVRDVDVQEAGVQVDGDLLALAHDRERA